MSPSNLLILLIIPSWESYCGEPFEKHMLCNVHTLSFIYVAQNILRQGSVDLAVDPANNSRECRVRRRALFRLRTRRVR